MKFSELENDLSISDILEEHFDNEKFLQFLYSSGNGRTISSGDIKVTITDNKTYIDNHGEAKTQIVIEISKNDKSVFAMSETYGDSYQFEDVEVFDFVECEQVEKVIKYWRKK